MSNTLPDESLNNLSENDLVKVLNAHNESGRVRSHVMHAAILGMGWERTGGSTDGRVRDEYRRGTWAVTFWDDDMVSLTSHVAGTWVEFGSTVPDSMVVVSLRSAA